MHELDEQRHLNQWWINLKLKTSYHLFLICRLSRSFYHNTPVNRNYLIDIFQGSLRFQRCCLWCFAESFKFLFRFEISFFLSRTDDGWAGGDIEKDVSDIIAGIAHKTSVQVVSLFSGQRYHDLAGCCRYRTSQTNRPRKKQVSLQYGCFSDKKKTLEK